MTRHRRLSLLLLLLLIAAAGCPKRDKAVPAEVEIEWPDAAPHASPRDGATGADAAD